MKKQNLVLLGIGLMAALVLLQPIAVSAENVNFGRATAQRSPLYAEIYGSSYTVRFKGFIQQTQKYWKRIDSIRIRGYASAAPITDVSCRYKILQHGGVIKSGSYTVWSGWHPGSYVNVDHTFSITGTYTESSTDYPTFTVQIWVAVSGGFFQTVSAYTFNIV